MNLHSFFVFRCSQYLFLFSKRSMLVKVELLCVNCPLLLYFWQNTREVAHVVPLFHWSVYNIVLYSSMLLRKQQNSKQETKKTCFQAAQRNSAQRVRNVFSFGILLGHSFSALSLFIESLSHLWHNVYCCSDSWFHR